MEKKQFIKKFIRENWMLILAILYVLSPVDFIPDFIPMLGLGDDLGALIISLLIKFLQERKNAKKEILEGETVEDDSKKGATR